MTKVLVAHPGTQYTYQLINQLNRHNVPFTFYTCIAFGEHSLFYRISYFLIGEKLKNRLVQGVSRQSIKTFYWLELITLFKIKIGLNPELVLFQRNKTFQERIPKHVLQEADVIIGFDTSSWILSQRCKQLGKPFILDQTIAHPLEKEKIYSVIRNEYPIWAESIKKKQADMIALEAMEHLNATIITVASSFTASTLINNQIPANKIRINPYGVDLQKFAQFNRSRVNERIRFIFIGSVTARKGIPNLLNVWENIDPSKAELVIIGPVSESIKDHIPKVNHIKLLGGVPHTNIPGFLNESDVFIFPSFFEGFGLVILEAMAAGLPVITTTATAGADLIENGNEGFVMEPGNDAILLESIRHFINNPSEIQRMGTNANNKARQYTWDACGDRWEKLINEIVC